MIGSVEYEEERYVVVELLSMEWKCLEMLWRDDGCDVSTSNKLLSLVKSLSHILSKKGERTFVCVEMLRFSFFVLNLCVQVLRGREYALECHEEVLLLMLWHLVRRLWRMSKMWRLKTLLLMFLGCCWFVLVNLCS